MTISRPAAALILLSLAGAGIAAAPQVVGINAAVLNDVRIRSAGTPQPRPAVVRQRVALADQIQTGQRSQLQVLLLDKSVFTVGANAQLMIDRFVYDPASGKSFAASVAKGAFRFMSGRSDRGGNASVNTPVATIGIRGTIFDGVVGPDAIAIASGERGIDRSIRGDPTTASLIILRGPGKRTQGKALAGAITVTAAGQTVSLDQPLLAAYVPARGVAPIGPFTISLSGLARVQALIFPSLAEQLANRPPIADAPAYQPPISSRPRPRGYALPVPMEGDSGPAPVPSFGDVPIFRPTARPEPAPQRAQSAPVTPPSQAPQSAPAAPPSQVPQSAPATPSSQPSAPPAPAPAPAAAPSQPSLQSAPAQPSAQPAPATPPSQSVAPQQTPLTHLPANQNLK
jgi:hypothetical protein